MPRSALIPPLLLTALLGAPAAFAADRYSPAESGLRGTAPVLSDRALLTWASKDARLRQQQQPPAAQSAKPAPPVLRGAAPAQNTPWAAQASAPPRRLQDLRAARAPLPDSIYDAQTPVGSTTPDVPVQRAPQTYQPNAQSRPTYNPQGPMLRARAYSVGREWGVQPDPIAMPDPSVMAYAPEVASAVIAQQEREKQGGVQFNPASPADLDMLEQQQQDANRKAQRDKVQAENRAKKAK